MNKADRLWCYQGDSLEGCLVRKHVGIAEYFIADAWRGMKWHLTFTISKSTYSYSILYKVFPPIKCSLGAQPYIITTIFHRSTHYNWWEVHWQCYELACKTKEDYSMSNLKFVIRNCVVNESSYTAI